MSMLTLSLLCKVYSITEWFAVWNDDIVEGKRAFCMEDVFDMELYKSCLALDCLHLSRQQNRCIPLVMGESSLLYI